MPDLDNKQKLEKLHRRKRIQRIKNMIVCFFIMLVVIPSIACIASQIKIRKLEKTIDELNDMLDKKLYEQYELSHVDEVEASEGGEEQAGKDEGQAGSAEDDSEGKEEGGDDGKGNGKPDNNQEKDVPLNPKQGSDGEHKVSKNQKRVYLTFDDGPSDNSNKILDILKKNKVKATFFVIGKKGKKAEAVYRRIVDEGHTLAMHSYTHDYSRIYKNLNAFKKDVTDIQDYLYEVTGVHSLYYRFPGGSSNSISKVPIRKCIKWLKSKNIEYYDWNSMTGDASGHVYTANRLVSNAMQDVERFQNSVVLLHDANDKDRTVECLPSLIKKLKKKNYAILPISEETVPVQHVK